MVVDFVAERSSLSLKRADSLMDCTHCTLPTRVSDASIISAKPVDMRMTIAVAVAFLLADHKHMEHNTHIRPNDS